MNKILMSNIQLFKTINAHSQIVTSFLLLKDKRFASCSSDSTIKVYNLSNGLDGRDLTFDNNNS